MEEQAEYVALGTESDADQCNNVIIVSAILAGLSLALYGGYSYKENVFAPTLSGGKGGQLEWAFYVGVAGAGTCFIASILFFVDGCIQAQYRDYKSPVLGTQ